MYIVLVSIFIAFTLFKRTYLKEIAIKFNFNEWNAVECFKIEIVSQTTKRIGFFFMK